MGTVQEVLTFNDVEGARCWSVISQAGADQKTKYNARYKEIQKNITPEDVATIIYTSGTTGLPKGVMLTHSNLMSNMQGVWDLFELNEDTRVLSFLPLCHVYERLVNYLFQAKGCTIYYAENLGTIAADMASVKANAFATVPRVIERIYDKIVSKGEDLSGIKKIIFFWAMR